MKEADAKEVRGCPGNIFSCVRVHFQFAQCLLSEAVDSQFSHLGSLFLKLPRSSPKLRFGKKNVFKSCSSRNAVQAELLF